MAVLDNVGVVLRVVDVGNDVDVYPVTANPLIPKVGSSSTVKRELLWV